MPDEGARAATQREGKQTLRREAADSIPLKFDRFVAGR